MVKNGEEWRWTVMDGECEEWGLLESDAAAVQCRRESVVTHTLVQSYKSHTHTAHFTQAHSTPKRLSFSHTPPCSLTVPLFVVEHILVGHPRVQ